MRAQSGRCATASSWRSNLPEQAKGLEFLAVVVMAGDDEVLPLQERIETIADEGDLHDVFETGHHLLCVACTRARDYQFVTGVAPASELLEDLG